MDEPPEHPPLPQDEAEDGDPSEGAARPAASGTSASPLSLRRERQERRPAGTHRGLLWTLPLLLLTLVWLWLAYSSGGFLERQWLPQALVVSLFAFIVYLLIAYPRRPRQLSMAVILFFALYALWVTLSAIWAPSIDRVWEEAGRTFTYSLILTLALTYLTEERARWALRYLLLAGGLLLVGVALWKLTGGGADIRSLFLGKRFVYPTTYPNSAAAVYLVLFWPLLWIAADPEERVPWRGVSLATCWGLLSVAVLCQSRGAVWALAATAALAMLISPARLRTLAFLLVPTVMMIGAFPRLNAYWELGPAEVGAWTAPRAILVGMGVALLLGVALALLERWVHVSRRMRLVFGTAVLLAVVSAGIYGWVQFEERAGSPVVWVQDTWDRFTAEQETTIPGLEGSGRTADSPSTRFATVSASGRWNIWKTAWQTFEEERWHGVGAGNFTLAHYRLREHATIKPRQPHSIELRLLSETGIIGTTLFGVALLMAIGGALWPRYGAGWWWAKDLWNSRGNVSRPAQDGAEPPTPAGGAQGDEPPEKATSALRMGRWGNDPRWWAWNAFLALGVLYWFIHGSVEWLWHQPGVTVPALLMLALAVSTTDARAGVLWPRWQKLLAGSHQVTPFLLPPMVVMMRRRMGGRPPASPPPEPEQGIVEKVAGGTPAATPADVGLSPARDEDTITIVRRSDKHEDRWRKEARREARRRRRRSMIRPPGGVSVWFRRAAIVVSAVVFLGLAAPYVSSRLQAAALHTATTDGRWTMRYVTLSHWLQPADPGPFLTEAAAFRKIAETADPSSPRYREGLALALAAHIEAIEHDPAWWVVHYQAGNAAVRLLDAGIQEADTAGLGTPDGQPAFADYPWVPADRQAAAAALLALPPDDLRLLARSYYLAAQERNPLDSDVARMIRIVEE